MSIPTDRRPPTSTQWYAGKAVPGVEYVTASGDGVPDRWYCTVQGPRRVELSPGDWVINNHDGTFGVRSHSGRMK